MPKPSSIPSVICLVPQNGMFFWIPVLAISCAAVGHVTASAAIALPATTTSVTPARRSPSGVLRRQAAARVTSVLPICSLLDPGMCGR